MPLDLDLFLESLPEIQSSTELSASSRNSTGLAATSIETNALQPSANLVTTLQHTVSKASLSLYMESLPATSSYVYHPSTDASTKASTEASTIASAKPSTVASTEASTVIPAKQKSDKSNLLWLILLLIPVVAGIAVLVSFCQSKQTKRYAILSVWYLLSVENKAKLSQLETQNTSSIV